MNDIYYKILSVLKEHSHDGEFIEITEKLPDLKPENIKSACSALAKEKKLQVKSSGEYHFLFPDGSSFNNKTNKISAKILPDGIKYLEEINNPKSNKDISFKAGDGGPNGDGGDLIIQAGNGHFGGKGGDLFIKAGDGENIEPKKSWLSKFWTLIVIPVLIGLALLAAEYGWFVKKDIDPVVTKEIPSKSNDSLLAVDKRTVIKKVVKEVFGNFDETISTFDRKYTAISALDYINDYLKKEFDIIESRIKNKSYLTRFSQNLKSWTESDVNEVNTTLRIKTINRIKEILEDIENKSQGPFVFSDEKLGQLRKQVIFESTAD